MQRPLMHHFTQKSLLLVTVILLWVVQIALPLLDAYTWVSINDKISIPASEIVAQFFSVPTMLSVYCLLYVSAGSKITLSQSLQFLCFSSILTCGHGIHVASVIIQPQLDPSNSIYSLVFALHEYYSHNLFFFGFYCLMLLVIWAEKDFALSKQKSPRSPTGEPSSGHSVNNEDDGKDNKLQVKSGDPSSILVVVMRWVWPVFMALPFSILARETTTEVLAALFYSAVLSAVVLIRQQFSSWKLYRSDLIISEIMGKASVVGLGILFIY